MEVQVTTICKSGFYYSRKINKIREYFSLKSAETLVHALVTSRLDFGNALLYGLSNTLLVRIQKVQKGFKKGSHNTSIVAITLVADQGKNCIQDTVNHL